MMVPEKDHLVSSPVRSYRRKVLALNGTSREEGRSQPLAEPRTGKPPCHPSGATTEQPRLAPTGLTRLSAGPGREGGG